MHMPRKNVTRFFIPLIDVLILLFCIFLLMEFSTGTKAEEQAEKLLEVAESEVILQEELQKLADESAGLQDALQKLKQLNPTAEEFAKLQEELERLRKGSQETVQKALVRIIDIDGKDGSISFYDHKNPTAPVLKITDAKAAHILIKQHKDEAKGREVYYYFMYPRSRSIYPVFRQEQEYQAWFKSVANSLVKVG